MKNLEIQVLSETVNCPVVSMPGRRFPGVVIQGDSLKILFDLVDEIENLSCSNEVDELRETIGSLKRKLGGYIEEYEVVMKAHGKQLPYVK